MKTSLFVVEGPHDSAAVCKILQLNGFESINKKEEVPACFRELIPVTYPFSGDSLDRVAPIPHFVKMRDERCVAVCVAAGDSNIANKLCVSLKNMDIHNLEQVMAIGILLDADKKEVVSRKKKLLQELGKACMENDWKIEEDILKLYMQKIPYMIYALPDDEHEGTLEDILLLNQEGEYGELKCLANHFVEKVPYEYQSCWKNADEKKVKVGVISNVLRPGKANQISILDCSWFTKESINQIPVHKKFAEFVLRAACWERG